MKNRPPQALRVDFPLDRVMNATIENLVTQAAAHHGSRAVPVTAAPAVTSKPGARRLTLGRRRVRFDILAATQHHQ